MKTITKFYEAPVAEEQVVIPEGVLCSSLQDTTVDDYVYKEFEW